MIHLNNSDIFNDEDITRCGVVADSFLKSLYFSSNENLTNKILLHNFNLKLLKNKIKTKNIICKITCCAWEKLSFQKNQSSGDFLIDLLPLFH